MRRRRWRWWCRFEPLQPGRRVVRLEQQRVHQITGRRLPGFEAGHLVEDALHDEVEGFKLGREILQRGRHVELQLRRLARRSQGDEWN